MQSNLIAQNIKILQSEINTIAEKNVKLIAVSKKKPLAMIEQAFDLGINDFGENFAQELKEKAELAHNSETIRKIKSLAKRYGIIISVGSLILKESGQEIMINLVKRIVRKI